MTNSQLSGNTGGGEEGESANSFVGKIYGNTQSCLLNEKALNLIHCPDVLLNVACVNAACPLRPTIQVFVNICDTILPDLMLPFRRGQLIFQNSRKTV